LKPTNDERGFTLVETLVAMVILTIGLVSLAELMAVSLRLQQLGRNETEAVRLAQDKVDELMMLTFGPPGPGVEDIRIVIGGSLTANVANHFDTQAGPDGALGTADDLAQLAGYTRRWVVAAGPDADPNLRQVTIHVIPTLEDRRTTVPYELITIIRRI